MSCRIHSSPSACSSAFGDSTLPSTTLAHLVVISLGLGSKDRSTISSVSTYLPRLQDAMLIEDAVLNGVGLVGRLVPAYLADQYFGPLNCLIPFVFVSGLLIYCWAAVVSPSTSPISSHWKSCSHVPIHCAVCHIMTLFESCTDVVTGGLTVFAVIYGLSAAGIQSLFPATITSLTTDLKRAGVRMGMIFTTVSLAVLTGSPLAGALIQERNGNYLSAQMFGGSVLIGGCCVLVAARLARTGKKFKIRV